MLLPLFAGLMLAGGSAPDAAPVSSPTCEYRLLREESSEFRLLGRRSILYGPTEFRVTAPEPREVVAVTIMGEGLDTLTGREEILCKSRAVANLCRVDFGDVIARRSFRIDAELEGPDGGTPTVHSERFVTLDTHPAGFVSLSGPRVLVERTRSEAFPPDEVRRLVRVERSTGAGDEKTILYRDDLTQHDFRVEVGGIRGAKIIAVEPPNPERKKLIPIFFNVSTYLLKRSLGEPKLDWQDNYRYLVLTLVQGLGVAAKLGVDAEFIVVPYAATARVFGPFHLYPGEHLDDPRLRSNQETLQALTEFLLEPPLPRWDRKLAERWVDDFAGMIHTLNDLYLRAFDGLVQAVWVTGGWSNPAGPRFGFQEEMWPERLEELNPEWSRQKMVELLERLDSGNGIRDDAMVEFIDALEEYNPPTAARVTTFMRAVDPGATDTLHPHRVDSSPVINVLFVPSDRSLRADRMYNFTRFVEQNYGGQIFRLFKIRKNAVEQLEEKLAGPGAASKYATVAQVLERTHEQLDHSYVIDFEVPNPHQDGGRHALEIETVESKDRGKDARLGGFEVAYMPYYTSSGSVRSRLLDYLRSGFKDLRLLAAYELRNHWSESDVLPAWADRWQVEEDPQIRSVLFETWISINLKRIQALDSGKRQRREAEEAYDKLRHAFEEADQLPDPDLARRAAMVAEWYRADHD